nr:polysaccharide biosynthesis C-terminal domain-containing protein [Sphaerisporangium rubeum]
MAVLCLTAPVLIPLVYGAEFRDSAVALFGLAPGVLLYAVTRPIWTHLVRLDRPGTATGIAVLAFALNAALALALIPAFGMLGCAIASSIAFACFAATQTAWFLRATGLPLSAIVPGPREVRAVLRILARVRQRLATRP